jgi:hypothetical protein
MNNQINSENNTLQNSFDLQKTEVSRKAWTEPQIENLDINAGKLPYPYEIMATGGPTGSSPT